MMYQSTRLLAFSYVPGSAPPEVLSLLESAGSFRGYTAPGSFLHPRLPSAGGLVFSSARGSLLHPRNLIWPRRVNDGLIGTRLCVLAEMG